MYVALVLAVVVAAAKPAPPPPVACVAPEPAAVTSSSVPARVRVMVPDLEVSPRYIAARGGLLQVVAEVAGRVRGYELLSADEVRSVLSQEANKQLLGCDESSCLAELAEALDAELVISGRVVDGPDGSALVSLSLLNARAIVVMNRVTVEWRGPQERLADVVRTSTQRLLLEPKERPPGTITVSGAPDDARVVVDGVDRTAASRAGPITDVEIGVHEIDVTAADKIAARLPVVVLSGADSVVDATLEDVPVPAVWLWVGGIGAVVAGAAVAGALIWFSGPGTVDVVATAPDVDNPDDIRSIGK